MSFFKKFQLNDSGLNDANSTADTENNPTMSPNDWDLFTEGVSRPRPYKKAENLSQESGTARPEDETQSNSSDSNSTKNLNRGSNLEINQVFEEILWIVKEYLNAQTVVLYWVNRNKKQFIFETAVTDSKLFESKERLDFTEKNLMVQVTESKEATTRFNFSSLDVPELIPYYKTGEKVNSFLAIPVFFGNDVCAVLAVDSISPSAFGGEELSVVNRFGRMISNLVQVYSRKEELEFSSKFNENLSFFINELQRLKNVKRLYEEVVDVINQSFEYSALGLVFFDSNGELKVQRSVNKTGTSYITEGSGISVNNSLVGSVMKSLNPINLKSTEGTMDNRFRYNPDENIHLDSSLCCVPVYSSQKCYGAIVLEHEKKGWFSGQQLQSLDQIGFISGLMFENIVLDEIAESQKIFDDLTGVFDGNFFFNRMSVELTRAARVGFDICYLTFELDDFTPIQQKYGKFVTDMAATQLAQLLKLNLRNYDLLGRISDNQFGALMVHSDANNAFLIAEKIREHVASTPLKFEKIELPVTMSIGIARFKKEKATVEAMIDGSLAALRRAQETGGNNVKTS